MAKKSSTILTQIIRYAVIALIFIVIPALINFFGQPKYGVFDGLTLFAGKYKIFLGVLLFGLAYTLRVLVKKQRPEVIKGAAVFLFAGLLTALLLSMSSGLVRFHAFAFLYLTGWGMFLAYYFLDEIPGIGGKIKEVVMAISKTAGNVIKWIWRVFLFVFGAVLMLAIAKSNYEFGNFFRENIIGLAMLFFLVPAAWRFFVKKEKYSFLLSAGIFIITGFAAILLSIPLEKLSFIDLRVFNYYAALIAAYLSMRDAAVLNFITGLNEKIKAKVAPAVKKGLKSAAEFTGKYTKKSAAKVKEVKNKRIKALWVVAAIVGAIAAFNLGKFIYDKSFVSVLALTPKGEVGENIMITAEFSKPVDLRVKDVTELKCFTIKPEIKGKYSFENKKTVIFTPDEPLLPSMDYEVVMNPGTYFSAVGRQVIGSPKTQFHTPYMKITDSRFFANKDIMKNEEKEVVGEVNFNYPVSAEELKKFVEVTKIIMSNCSQLAKKESPMKFTIEPSESPLRFYIRIPDISRSYDCQDIRIKIASGIKCPQCGIGLQENFEQSVNISQKQYLFVESVAPWQQEGETSVAVRFNMPVSEEQVKKYVTIVREATVNKPAEVMKYTLKTEYCYAVFAGDFEPNLNYRVTVGNGIVSKNNDPIKVSDPNRPAYEQNVTVQDLPSSFEYAEGGEILSAAGTMNVGLRVMNLDRIRVKLYKVFKNNLVHYLRTGSTYEYGNQVLDINHDITGGKINQEITEYINFKNYQQEPYKGIFIAEIADAKNSWDTKRKIIRCTNLGMIAKQSGQDMHVKVINISTLQPAAYVDLKLMSTTNQVMKETKTDEAGKAVFKNWRTGMYNFYPYLVLAESGDDFSYLVFDGSMLDNYRFETGGEPTLGHGMKSFVTTDRGLYRPGETVNITAIVRNNDMTMPPEIKIENRITGPQGEVVQTDSEGINAQGMQTFKLKLQLSAMTGEYRSDVRVNGGTIGSVTFKVEEFIPDKLEVMVKTDIPEILPGSPLMFTVQANQMFGPPAAGNKVETEVKFTDYTFQSKKFKDFVFRDPQKSFSEKFERLGGVNLDGIGKYRYEVPVPAKANPPSAMQAEIYTEVFDDGGRPVGAYKVIPVHVYNYYLGVKLRDPRKIYKRGDNVEVNIAAVNSADEAQKVSNVEVLVKRKVWYSIFRSSRWNSQSYDSSSYEEAVLYKVMDINGLATLTFPADVEGEYYIYVGNEAKMRTGIVINVTGPAFTTYDMSNAEKITIATDKAKYKAGDTAVISIKAPFDGMAYITLDRDKIYYEKYVQVINGSAVIEIPIKEEYLPNVYLNIVAVRKPDEKYMSLPFAAYGVENISIDKSAKDLDPKIVCKDEVMSTEGIAVEINNLPAGTAAVLAAVDEGILQIIRFETPDPLSFFFRKKALETRTYTVFNKLLSDMAARKRAIGGDLAEDAGPMAKHLNPIMAKNVESYAKFSGIVFADANGSINYKFDTKKFNGKVRVMVFTVKGDKFGSDSKKTNVVDPIVITPTLPRFLAPGDEFFLPVRVYNNTTKDSPFEIKVDMEGPVTIEKAVLTEENMKSKGEKIFVFRGRANDSAGKAVFNITASGAGETMSVARELAVRPAAHLETKVYRGSLEPGKEFKFDVPANFITQGKRTRVLMSYSRAAEYAGAFEYLINYPYGCLEQTVSSAFPMLYFKDLGITKMLLEYQAINTETYVNETIKRLRKFVLPGNRITFWPGASYDASVWTKLYLAHFVIEAKRKGYFVPEDLYSSILAASGLAAGTQISMQVEEPTPEGYDEPEETSDGGEGEGEGDEYSEGESEEPAPQATLPPRLDRRSVNSEAYNFENNIYKLYLKSLLEQPDANTMKYYEDLYAIYVKKKLNKESVLKQMGYTAARISNMQNSLEKDYLIKGNLIERTAAGFVNNLNETDKFLLSMSYAQFNNPEAARMVVYEDFKSKYMIRELNGFFNSYARNLGMYLSAVSLAEGKMTPRIENGEELLLGQLKEDGSFGSTQENSWALIGLGQAAKVRGKGQPINADVYVNGEVSMNTAGAENVSLNDKENKWKQIKILSKGGAKFFYNIFVEGTPKEKNKKSMSKGLKISRKYFDEEGREANLTSVTQGKLIVVSVTLEPQSGRQLDNVVVVDMLPAGFEIENPRIKTRGSLKFTPVSNFDAVYEDIRDDRMLMFTGAFSSAMTFSYTVRAVSPGKFTIPNAYAEAMYDPDVKAESYEGDFLVVVPNKF